MLKKILKKSSEKSTLKVLGKLGAGFWYSWKTSMS
jgi:hypothetical protein